MDIHLKQMQVLTTNSTSKLFKNNNSIVKVNHRDHGFEDSGDSYVFYRTALETGGVTCYYSE